MCQRMRGTSGGGIPVTRQNFMAAKKTNPELSRLRVKSIPNTLASTFHIPAFSFSDLECPPLMATGSVQSAERCAGLRVDLLNTLLSTNVTRT